MTRLMMIAATGFLAVLLTACGESNNTKPADTTVVVPAEDKGTSTTVVVPPEDKGTDSTTTTTTTQPADTQNH